MPGAVVGVSAPGMRTVTLSLGTVDVDAAEAPRASDAMRIGSIAKLFTGTVVLQLADEGRLAVDDPVSRYVTGVPHGDKITLRMLGNHTSGLFNSIADRAFRARINRDPSARTSRSEILRTSFSRPVRLPPGQRFTYSNTNTTLLAMVAEKVTGQSIASLITTRILEPLGATGTEPPGAGLAPPPAVRGYRFGERRNAVEYGKVFFDATHFSASWGDAAGDMNSTLDDLMRLARPLVSGRLLTDRGRDELTRFVETGASFRYGFCLSDYDGALGHAGDVPGFSSFVAWLPRRDAVVVVLTNLSNLRDKSSPAQHLARRLIAELRAVVPSAGPPAPSPLGANGSTPWDRLEFSPLR
ncbi:MAG: serine hydrolase domain-containing protein [Pseudomonadota bacterium]